MRRAALTLVALATGLSLSGCAVLTVDVDVYKGALANHEDVQTEQVAAMAMGAKPLLAELRYKLEKANCLRTVAGTASRTEQETCPPKDVEKANFVSPELLRSRDAKRVNEILWLYQDRKNQLLDAVGQAATRLIKYIESGVKIIGPYLFDAKRRPLPDAQHCGELLARRVLKAFGSGSACRREPTASQIEAVRLVWEGFEDTWQEAIRILSSREIRARLKEASSNAVFDVAWIAADLTSGEGLRRFLTDLDTPAALKTGPLSKLGELLPALTNGDRSLFGSRDAVEAVAAVLAQRLADDESGPDLARQLAMAQGYAVTRSARDWFIVEYPSPYWFGYFPNGVDTDVLVTDLLATARQGIVEDLKADLGPLVGGLALGAGRPKEGLEILIEEYIETNSKRSGLRNPRDVDDKRKKLFDALVNFAEKVTIIANFDPLVREKESAYDENETKRYVRVLQAVGNSILSQVDVLTQVKAHRGGLTNARETEVEGIRNAEARAAAVLRQIIAELKAKDNFPDKDDIQAALNLGLQDLDKIVSQLSKTAKRESAELAKERATATQWATAYSVINLKEIQDAVEQSGQTTVRRTTADVARKIIDELKTWAGAAEFPQGVGKKEAENLRDTGTVLDKFTSNTTDHGTAREKYLNIVNNIAGELTKTSEKKAAEKLKTAHSVLTRKEVEKIVEQYGKETERRTEKAVGEIIISVLKKRWEQARHQGKAGDEEARRSELQKVTDSFVELALRDDLAESVKEKYSDILLKVKDKWDSASKKELTRAAPVADLERWHASVRRLSEGGSPALAIPKRIRDGLPYEDGQKPTAKDVLDVMVATLRHEHVNAMKEHGPDNPITKNLAAAVELNYAYRSGMVHIRPASVFLRNSYPASILQQDPAAGVWRNMLTDHAKRQLPFYDWWQGQKEEAKINNAIDKQFWQSVNQVRVSGTGDTNYAIAKDDVGNWYVKSYASDPAPIINSARSLAMFSAGSAMGANFLTRGGQSGKPGEIPGTVDGSIPQEIRSTLGKQLDRVSERYEKATREVRAELAKEIGNINANIKKVLGGGKLTDTELNEMFPDPKETQTEVKNGKPDVKDTNPNPELAELIKTLREDKQKVEKPKEANQKDGKLKPDSVLNAEIAKGLRAIKSYRTAVQNKLNMKIASEDKPAATSPATKTTPAPSPATPVPVAPPPPTANPTLPPPPAPSPPNAVAPSVPNPAAPAAPIPAAPNQAATPSPAPNPPAPTQAAPAPAETKSTDTKKLSAKEGEEAKKAVDKVFKDLLEKFISERKTTNAEYESALQLMHEFAEL